MTPIHRWNLKTINRLNSRTLLRKHYILRNFELSSTNVKISGSNASIE